MLIYDNAQEPQTRYMTNTCAINSNYRFSFKLMRFAIYWHKAKAWRDSKIWQKITNAPALPCHAARDVPYHLLPSRVCMAVCCRAITCRVVSSRVVLWQDVSYHARKCCAVLCRIVSCRTISYRSVPCRAMSCLAVLSRCVLSGRVASWGETPVLWQKFCKSSHILIN